MPRFLAARLGSTALGAFLGCSLFFLLLQLPIAAGPPAASGNGDINGDQQIDIGDAVALLGYLFGGGPAPVAIAGPSCPACDLTQAEVDELTALLSLVTVAGNGGLTISTPAALQIQAGTTASITSNANLTITTGATLDANGTMITLN